MKSRIHYKMYKSKKRWIFATISTGIAVISIGSNKIVANADNNNGSSNSSSTVIDSTTNSTANTASSTSDLNSLSSSTNNVTSGSPNSNSYQSSTTSSSATSLSSTSSSNTLSVSSDVTSEVSISNDISLRDGDDNNYADNFSSDVYNALKKELNGQDVTAENIGSVSSLSFSNSDYPNGISSLKGLDLATNLKSLTISNVNLNNSNSELSPIFNLNNLQTLSIDSSNVDVSELFNNIDKLTNLTDLTLNNTNLSSYDLTPIFDLKQLKALTLNHDQLQSSQFNKVTNSSNILSNLETLNIGYNNVSDLTPMSGWELDNLSNFMINNNNIVDPNPLANFKFPNIWYLNADNNDISDISVFTKLTDTWFKDSSGNWQLHEGTMRNLGSVEGTDHESTRLSVANNKFSDMSQIIGAMSTSWLYADNQNASKTITLVKPNNSNANYVLPNLFINVDYMEFVVDNNMPFNSGLRNGSFYGYNLPNPNQDNNFTKPIDNLIVNGYYQTSADSKNTSSLKTAKVTLPSDYQSEVKNFKLDLSNGNLPTNASYNYFMYQNFEGLYDFVKYAGSKFTYTINWIDALPSISNNIVNNSDIKASVASSQANSASSVISSNLNIAESISNQISSAFVKYSSNSVAISASSTATSALSFINSLSNDASIASSQAVTASNQAKQAYNTLSNANNDITSASVAYSSVASLVNGQTEFYDASALSAYENEVSNANSYSAVISSANISASNANSELDQYNSIAQSAASRAINDEQSVSLTMISLSSANAAIQSIKSNSDNTSSGSSTSSNGIYIYSNVSSNASSSSYSYSSSSLNTSSGNSSDSSTFSSTSLSNSSNSSNASNSGSSASSSHKSSSHNKSHVNSIINKRIYNVNTIYSYSKPTFSAKNRKEKFKAVNRTSRGMFKVIGAKNSNYGRKRYLVVKINPKTNKVMKRTSSNIGYVTANNKFVKSLYYSRINSDKKVRVLTKLYQYRNTKLTGKRILVKKGRKLNVESVKKVGTLYRFKLSNGNYVTSNKRYVIFDKY